MMKLTWVTFGLGWLAILGIPPFSGFWSKDKIIEVAFIGDGWKPWVFGLAALLGAGLTAYYMSRLFFMTFHGEKRWTDGQHPHESPLLMTIPMAVLAAGSALLGLFLALGDGFVTWLAPITGHAEHGEPVLAAPLIVTLTLVLVALGVAAAYFQYVSRPVPVAPPRASVLTLAARQDFFQDTVNATVFQWPGQVATRVAVYTDAATIDGAVNTTASGTARAGEALRRLQTGNVRTYSATMLIGVVVLLAIVAKGGF